MSTPTPQQLITDHLDLWSGTVTARKSSGRGSNSKQQLHGIKKLRELILELAVRGKLVPQNPADEPASVLLEKIAAERAQLIKEKKIKKQKALPEISEYEKPFELPEGWALCRLGELALTSEAGWSPRCESYPREGNKWGVLKVSAVTWDVFDPDENKALPTKLEPKPEYEVSAGDFLISRANTAELVAKSVVVPKGAPKNLMMSDKIIRFRFSEEVFSSFIQLVNNSPSARFYYASVAGGTSSSMKNVSRAQISNLIIAIPPYAEQHRIVAKIDELMALCDQLEQKTEQQLAAHQLLVTTLLGTLTNSQNAEELAENWARLSQHFDTLFTTESSIDQLKQTILQLAVMGKLVPQNPDGEPAAKLLERIAEEKAQLIKEKKIKKQKALPPIAEDEKPFELPGGWEWFRLGNFTLSSVAGWSPRCESYAREADNWGVLKVSAVTWGSYNPKENKALPNNLAPRPEYEVMSGDFLISRANTADLVARSVVVPSSPPVKLMMSDKIIRFRFAKVIDPNYVQLVNNSPTSRDYYASVAGGTSNSMKNVSRAQISNLVIAIPPYEEQTRIVEKVNQLFALCDQLKTRLQENQQTRLQLTDSLVQQALAV